VPWENFIKYTLYILNIRPLNYYESDRKEVLFIRRRYIETFEDVKCGKMLRLALTISFFFFFHFNDVKNMGMDLTLCGIYIHKFSSC